MYGREGRNLVTTGQEEISSSHLELSDTTPVNYTSLQLVSDSAFADRGGDGALPPPLFWVGLARVGTVFIERYSDFLYFPFPGSLTGESRF